MTKTKRFNYRTLDRKLTCDELARFWSKVEIRDINECWPWLAATDSGYGVFGIDNKTYRAHRVSYFIQHNMFPTYDIDHTCENKLCVNPFHLEDVSLAENHRRYVESKLEKFCKNGHPRTDNNTGATNNGKRYCKVCLAVSEKKRYRQKYAAQRTKDTHTSDTSPKLDEEKVMEILRRHHFDGVSGRQLARDFQVSQPMIRYILKGESWRHVYDRFQSLHMGEKG